MGEIGSFVVVGTGAIAHGFMRAVGDVPGCRVIAVCDLSLDKARRFADRYGIDLAFDDANAMLDRVSPSCAYIATTVNAHAALSETCIEHGVGVLCEKVMFRGSAEAERVFALSERRRVFAMEAFWSRFLPANRAARQWIVDGRIGEPVFAHAQISAYTPDRTNRYYDPSLGGGVAHDLTGYAYGLTDMMLGHLGRTPVIDGVHATWSDSGVDTSNRIVMHVGDVWCTLDTTCLTQVDQRLEIGGSNGCSVVVPNPHFADEALLYDRNHEVLERFRDDGDVDGHSWQIRESIDMIRRGNVESPVVPHAFTMRYAKVCDMVEATRGERRP